MSSSRPSTFAPSLSTILKSLKGSSADASVEQLILLLKRRQIRNSRPCAIATAHVLLRVVAEFKGKGFDNFINRIQAVGQKLINAQPRELAVGNIVRRVLGLIREVDEDEVGDGGNPEGVQLGVANSTYQPPHDSLQRPGLTSSISMFSPLNQGVTRPIDPAASVTRSDLNAEESSARPGLFGSYSSYATSSTPMATSLFGLLSHPEASPLTSSSVSVDPFEDEKVRPLESAVEKTQGKENLKAEVLDGIRELLDELDQVDDQIAAYALDHIHSNEIILTHSSSMTVQRFLLAAARKRKFTVIHVEAFPNEDKETHALILSGSKKSKTQDSEAGDRFKPLTSAGITVIMIPDSAVFAIMSRINKVILAPHSVIANGGLIAAAGARTIAKAAKMHQTPVVVLSGVYKLSPVYPFDVDELIEYGDPAKVLKYDDGYLVERIDAVNPLFDYVPADLVSLYITNLGGHAPSYLYRIVADHYRVEDISF